MKFVIRNFTLILIAFCQFDGRVTLQPHIPELTSMTSSSKDAWRLSHETHTYMVI